MKKNEKGFTMVELLVAIAIMGLLIIMAFPTIRAIQTNNTNKKYEEYGNSAISAAKIYTDSYSLDMFETDGTNQIKKIYFDELVKKDLIKDINISDSTCISESSITVIKYKDDYAYCLHLVCKIKDSPATARPIYEENNRKGSCADHSEFKVTYNYNGNSVSKDVVGNDEDYIVVQPTSIGFNFNANHDVFIEWNTKSDFTGTVYNPGNRLPKITGNVNLYARTRKWEYFLYFDKGLGNGGSMTSPQKCSYGSDCKISENKFTKTGYTFNKWVDGNNNQYIDKENVKTKIGNNITKDGYKVNLTATYRINKVYVKINANGGSFASTYNHAYTKDSNGLISYNNNQNIHTINYGSNIGSSGLINYNNPSYLNLTRSGYSVKVNEEWNKNANGSGTTYNQTSNYTASELCSTIDQADCNITLYTKWKLDPPTCSLSISPAANGNGWNNSNTTITMTTTGILDEYGLATTQGSNNKSKTTTITTEGSTTYYGHVKNASSTASCSKTVYLDKTKPTVSISVTSQNSEYNTATANVTITAKDTRSGINKYCLTTGTSCTPGTNLTGQGTVNANKVTSTTHAFSSGQDGTSSKLTVCVNDKAGNVQCTSTSSAYGVYKSCTTTVDNGYTCGAYSPCSATCGGGTQTATKTQAKKDRYLNIACNSVTIANGCVQNCNTQSCCTEPTVTVSTRGPDVNNGLACPFGDRFWLDGIVKFTITGCADGLHGYMCYHNPTLSAFDCYAARNYSGTEYHTNNGYGHMAFKHTEWSYYRSTDYAKAVICNSDNQCTTKKGKYPY